jgi:excisionase family DNA binding protein
MPIEKEEWLTLSQAAGLLGVHPSTVRLWSDKGQIPVHRTQGNHRRYIRSEIELWAQTAHRAGGVEPDNIVQFALRRIRFKIGKGQLEAEVWYQALVIT